MDTFPEGNLRTMLIWSEGIEAMTGESAFFSMFEVVVL